MDCNPKCGYYGKEDEFGRPLRISRPGNPKFPGQSMVVHDQCPACSNSEIGQSSPEKKVDKKQGDLETIQEIAKKAQISAQEGLNEGNDLIDQFYFSRK